MSYIRVLIIGVHLRDDYGDGITTRNLFHNWPDDQLYFATTGEMISQLKGTLQYETYLLGSSEKKILWPFNMFFQEFSSRVIPRHTNTFTRSNTIPNNGVRLKSEMRKKVVNFLHFVGLYNIIFTLCPSSSFLQWVRQVRPDLIYFHPNSYQLIKFVHSVTEVTGVKAIYHVMDGTINDVNKLGVLYKFWNARTQRYIRDINQHINYGLCISEKMSSVLKEEYQKDFYVFHNCVDVKAWRIDRKKSSEEATYRITYTGRVGYDNWQLLTSIASAVDKMHHEGYGVSFNIYSSNMPSRFVKAVSQYTAASILPPVNHENMPLLLHNSDLLIIPLGFSRKSIKFSWLSIPTKTVEYMASGVPTLVIAPSITALYLYALETNWAITLDDCSKDEIIEILHNIIEGKINVAQYAERAYDVALHKHERSLVAPKFLQVLREV